MSIRERAGYDTVKYTYLVPEEAARNVDLLASHDDDFLAGENLLGDNRGQPTEEMALAIYDDRQRRECGHGDESALSRRKYGERRGRSRPTWKERQRARRLRICVR
jgi:hypothetical protein